MTKRRRKRRKKTKKTKSNTSPYYDGHLHHICFLHVCATKIIPCYDLLIYSYISTCDLLWSSFASFCTHDFLHLNFQRCRQISFLSWSTWLITSPWNQIDHCLTATRPLLDIWIPNERSRLTDASVYTSCFDNVPFTSRAAWAWQQYFLKQY